MKNFERMSPENIPESAERLTGKEKFEIILKLFGTNTARAAFIEVCKKYVALRLTSLADDHGENYVPRGGRVYSPPQRAKIHNQIMDTLQHLALQKLAPLQEKVLREMASREAAGQIIKDWVSANDHPEEEEEGESERKRSDMSGPAYFHSLGRGE